MVKASSGGKSQSTTKSSSGSGGGGYGSGDPNRTDIYHKELDVPLDGENNIHPTRIDKDGVVLVNGAGSPSQKGIKNINDFYRVHGTGNREYAAVFDKHGNIVGYMKGFKGHVQPKGFDKMKPHDKVLYHNHPGSGGPFSSADVGYATNKGYAIVASSKKTVYFYKPRNNMSSYEKLSIYVDAKKAISKGWSRSYTSALNHFDKKVKQKFGSDIHVVHDSYVSMEFDKYNSNTRGMSSKQRDRYEKDLKRRQQQAKEYVMKNFVDVRNEKAWQMEKRVMKKYSPYSVMKKATTTTYAKKYKEWL